MTLRYPIKITPDDNDTMLVTCPALPEVTTFGEDFADAERNAVDAIEEAIASRIADGRDVPPPRGPKANVVTIPTQTAIKVMLYRALEDEKITRAELQRRLSWKSRESVDRLFRIGHATRLEQFDAAFAALGRKVSISVD
jgi:antitoxin HicB